MRYFPYKPRRYQLETIEEIRKCLRRGHVCLNAATGFGKTPVILSALLPYVDAGYVILWAVRTGNETDRPIEELKVIVKKTGHDIFGISYRGKKDMCLLAKERFTELADHSEVSYLCKRVMKSCPYYNNYLARFKSVKFNYMSSGPLTYAEVYRISKDLNLCPYYAQRGLLPYAEVISLSYNYVVNPFYEWSIRSLIHFNEAILVVDEAHNLQNLDLISDTITLGTLERAKAEAVEFGRKDLMEHLSSMENLMVNMLKSLRDGEDKEFRPDELIPGPLVESLEDLKTFGEYVRRKRFEEGRRPRSSVYHLSRFIELCLNAKGVKGIAFIAEREKDNLRLHIWDMRASEILSSRWSLFKRCVFCSGTLEPIDAFADMAGIKRYVRISVPNFYRKENVRIYITKGITTRGEELSRDMAEKYVNSILGFLKVVNSNSAVFTSSYRVQERLIEAGLVEKAEKLGYKTFKESKWMSGQESREVLDGFKKTVRRGKGLLIAPMGGRFAEGADFPGEELSSIFLAGIPFERPTVRTQLYIKYYSDLYGEKGKEYAYIIPALRRAAQALGRAIRGPDDMAVLILGDERYEKYLEYLPAYVKEWSISIDHSMTSKIEVPWTSKPVVK